MKAGLDGALGAVNNLGCLILDNHIPRGPLLSQPAGARQRTAPASRNLMTRLAPGGLPPEANWPLYASYERLHLGPRKSLRLRPNSSGIFRKKPCRFVIPAKAKGETGIEKMQALKLVRVPAKALPLRDDGGGYPLACPANSAGVLGQDIDQKS